MTTIRVYDVPRRGVTVLHADLVQVETGEVLKSATAVIPTKAHPAVEESYRWNLLLAVTSV